MALEALDARERAWTRMRTASVGRTRNARVCGDSHTELEMQYSYAYICTRVTDVHDAARIVIYGHVRLRAAWLLKYALPLAVALGTELPDH